MCYPLRRYIQMKWSRTLWSFLLMSSACLLSVKKKKNFSQRISLIREVRKYRDKGKQSNKTK